MSELKPLIGYIVDQVNERGGSIGRTALTKLVYLVDVEHCRQYGKKATGLKWWFHHYGPYAAELQSEIQSQGLYADEEVFSGKSGNRPVTGYRYRRAGDWKEIHRAFNSQYDASVKRCVDKVVEQWALDSLPTILDYVYFETEPMQDVKRGDYLDFSKIQMESHIPPKTVKLEFSDEFINEMRQKLEEQRKMRDKKSKEARKATEPRYDEVYFEARRVMAEDRGGSIFFPETTEDRLGEG